MKSLKFILALLVLLAGEAGAADLSRAVMLAASEVRPASVPAVFLQN